MSAQNMKVNLSGWELENPVIPASGTFGFGYEFSQFYDINLLGSISLKGTTKDPRFGNATPRIAECGSYGMLNAIGLQNPGVEAVIAEELPKLREVFHKKFIPNLSGFSTEEFVYNAQRFDAVPDVGLLELNISCPNVQHGGMAFGQSCEAAEAVTAAVRKVVKNHPLYVKLSPNVTNVAEVAKAVEAAGADGIVCMNTLLGMVLSPRTGKPVVSIKKAGYSGPAVKPIAIRMVYEIYEAVKIPIIGLGGLATADDVLEMLWAGATAVEIGSANLIDPYACKTILEELPRKMAEYGIQKLTDIIGGAHQ